MLGIKIAATGALAILLSGTAIKGMGDYPGGAKGFILVVLWIVGADAVVIGAMLAVWA